MKKKYPFNVLSDTKCIDCVRPLKKRLVEDTTCKNKWLVMNFTIKTLPVDS